MIVTFAVTSEAPYTELKPCSSRCRLNDSTALFHISEGSYLHPTVTVQSLVLFKSHRLGFLSIVLITSDKREKP